MTVEPLVPDAPLPAHPSPVPTNASAFARALDGVTAVFDDAERAENAFASGAGSLQDAMYERARADVMLSVATAAAQRAAQAVQSILNLQV